MPSGENSRANLIQFSGRSRNEVQILQAKGGVNSGVTRREFKTFREELKKELTAERGARIIERLIDMAERGCLPAIKLILQIIGEDPARYVTESGKVEYVLSWGNGPEDYSETGYEVMEADTSSKQQTP